MKWWEKAVIYQVYPKSFADSNGDGIGDILGVITHLDELKMLGVNTLWLNPIFLSPQVDNGYDVSDYYDIDACFGTIQDVEVLLDEAHRRDMKVIFDLVLNHTSDQHPWFQEALCDTTSPYRNYYYFMDEKPNNWGSFFGGSVWEKTVDGSYYFHLFDKAMPDLNWTNPKVRQEMIEVARFWAKKGVDGFRLDAFIHIAKANFYLQGEPEDKIVVSEEYFANLPEVQTYLREFRETLDKEFPQLFYIGEASSASSEMAKSYMLPENHECDSVVTFRYFHEQEVPEDDRLSARFQSKSMDWREFGETMDEWQSVIGEVGYPTLYWNNHDMARVLSRFGEEDNPDSQKALATLMYLQKGIPVILYGEELGMKDWRADDIDQIPEDGARDFYDKAIALGYNKQAILDKMSHQSRNASRGMLVWDEARPKEWLGGYQLEVVPYHQQMQTKGSMWQFYQQLLQLKQQPIFTFGDYERLSLPPEVYAYTRTYKGERATIYVRLTPGETVVDLDNSVEIVLTNQVEVKERAIHLPQYGVAVVKEKIDE